MSLLTPLFAYGTLRPGQPLEGWLSGATAYHEPATVHGHALVIPEHGWYPYMIESADDTVRGDVLWVRDHEAVVDTAVMEARAGYEVGSVPAVLASGEIIHAVAFTWASPDPSWTRIPEGDWASWNGHSGRYETVT